MIYTSFVCDLRLAKRNDERVVARTLRHRIVKRGIEAGKEQLAKNYVTLSRQIYIFWAASAEGKKYGYGAIVAELYSYI